MIALLVAAVLTILTPDYFNDNTYPINIGAAQCPCALANITGALTGEAGYLGFTASPDHDSAVILWGSEYAFSNQWGWGENLQPKLTIARGRDVVVSFYVVEEGRRVVLGVPFVCDVGMKWQFGCRKHPQ